MSRTISFLGQTITSGPSKFDLSIALFDRKPVNQRTLRFAIQKDGRIEQYDVRVNGVSAEDSSGESWNVEGYATRHFFDSRIRFKETGHTVPAAPSRVSIFFRTDNRTGTMKFLD